MPSPSVDNRNEALAQPGSSSRLWSDARPPAPEIRLRLPARGRHDLAEHLDVASLVGSLGGEKSADLPVVRMHAAQESGRHQECGLLVLDQIGHRLHDGGLDLWGERRRRPVDGGGGIPLVGRGLCVQLGSKVGPHHGSFRSRSTPGSCGPPLSTRAPLAAKPQVAGAWSRHRSTHPCPFGIGPSSFVRVAPDQDQGGVALGAVAQLTGPGGNVDLE